MTNLLTFPKLMIKSTKMHSDCSETSHVTRNIQSECLHFYEIKLADLVKACQVAFDFPSEYFISENSSCSYLVKTSHPTSV